MRLNLPLATVFLTCWVISDPKTIPFVIIEPFGPKFNGKHLGLQLERIDNMDSKKKMWSEDVVLNLEWQYESSAVENDERSLNHNHASLRFIFETSNHDGWVIFG